jgi:hypothetical protein
MGSGYDEVAKAIATNVPRRKLLKMLAGGAVASLGSAIVASSAAAQPRSNTVETASASQSDVEQVPGFNENILEFFLEHPWWYPFYPFSNFLFGINGSNPF